MTRDELSAIAEPLLAEIKEHPFWHGLRNGTLPSAALWYFAEQDTRYVVPTYARALARTAAIADDDAHGALLCSAANATFGSVPRMVEELAKLADALGEPAGPAAKSGAGADPGAAADPGAGADPGAAADPPGPVIHAHTSFMLAAPTTSFAAGIGALLPMTWFHLTISNDLKERHRPGSRYASWIDQYIPGGNYPEYVEAYLTMIDEVGGRCSIGERDQLVRHFLLGARYEWAFADTAWRQQAWPI